MHLYLQAWPSAECVELTFELPDNAKECFHEIIEEGTESTLEFQVTTQCIARANLLIDHVRPQVVTGGHYDVDVVLTDPTRNVLYKQIKKQYDSHTWTAAKTGMLLLLVKKQISNAYYR